MATSAHYLDSTNSVTSTSTNTAIIAQNADEVLQKLGIDQYRSLGKAENEDEKVALT